jgi:hypothetical protein
MTKIPEDHQEPFAFQEGKEKRKQARRLFGQAALLEALAPDEAAVKIRECLAVAASAFYWLDRSELEEAAHSDLHKYGRFAREHFASGCEATWTGSRYELRCPVAIAHKRFGFSVGFTGKRLCSICRDDLSTCEHERGALYEIEGGIFADGYCRVCEASDCTTHGAGTHQVRCGSIVAEMTIEELSMVDRPVQPDARLTAIPMDTKQLAEFLGPTFKPGMPVSCDRCLSECPGFDSLQRPDE